MNRPDQPESTTESTEEVNEALLAKPQRNPIPTALSSASQVQESGFDWTALGVVILIAAFFAVTARYNAQPATSFVPAAVLSATGCGLLVTAIRKLRTSIGVGFLEAALSGFVIALFQCIVAITYPGVFDSLSLGQIVRDDFLITWSLVASFSIVFCITGAALGHLAFAPLRPLPIKSSTTVKIEGKDNEETLEIQPISDIGDEEESLNAVARSEDEEYTVEQEDQDTPIEDNLQTSSLQQPQRSVLSYLLTILLLGLAPTVVAYVFSA